MVLNKSKYCIVLYWQSDLLVRPRCSCWAWVVTALVQPHHHDCHHQSSMLVHRYVALIILSILLLLWLILLLLALLLLLLLSLKLMMMKYWHHLIPVLTGTSGATLNSRYSHLSHLYIADLSRSLHYIIRLHRTLSVFLLHFLSFLMNNEMMV